jgi:hypothetical protein
LKNRLIRKLEGSVMVTLDKIQATGRGFEFWNLLG